MKRNQEIIREVAFGRWAKAVIKVDAERTFTVTLFRNEGGLVTYGMDTRNVTIVLQEVADFYPGAKQRSGMVRRMGDALISAVNEYDERMDKTHQQANEENAAMDVIEVPQEELLAECHAALNEETKASDYCADCGREANDWLEKDDGSRFCYDCGSDNIFPIAERAYVSVQKPEYLVTDLHDEENTWELTREGVREFLYNIWESYDDIEDHELEWVQNAPFDKLEERLEIMEYLVEPKPLRVNLKTFSKPLDPLEANEKNLTDYLSNKGIAFDGYGEEYYIEGSDYELTIFLDDDGEYATTTNRLGYQNEKFENANYKRYKTFKGLTRAIDSWITKWG
jgi:hypothetical protein